ncbi:hypothetical protein [Terrimonas pollutisoli]|uniref:hypothetical protein n=1 Tax=Terrimonas pollutisoli TaxID=3034147 RepID=UPI0023EB6ED8|nr:hypothetical protein [Terrimonas sp. H1YJ31]
MLQDIASAIGSSEKVKVLTALPGSAEGNFAFDSSISFLPFVNYLKDHLAGIDDTRSRFYNYLIERFETEPALLMPIGDNRLLDEHSNLLELLGTALFPVVTDPEKNIFTLGVPYQFSIFNESAPFKKLFVDKEEHFLLPQDSLSEQIRQIKCSLIYEHALQKFYGIKLNANTDLVYPIADPATGLKRYYKLRYDNRFIDLHAKGDLPPIKDCAVCLNTFRILDLEHQMKKMPLDLFKAEGFGVWVAEDVTVQESLDAIKKLLLREETCSPGIIHELKECIHALTGLNEVEVGIAPFVKLNNEFVLDETCTRHGLMGKNWKTSNEEDINDFKNSIAFLSERPEPMPIPVVDENLMNVAPFFRDLLKRGMKSYLIYPVQNNDGLLGLLELASPVSNQLTLDIMTKLEPAMPLISLALLKNRDSFTERIEKLIKEKFTALQPSVEWKFAEVAWNYMKSPNGNGSGTASNVIFENVYPLYGAIDIRNSSLERSMALQKDVKAHLELIDATFDKLDAVMHLPLLEGLKFKNFNYKEAIDKSMQAEDEIRLNDFFTNEVNPVLLHLNKSNSKTNEVIGAYFASVNDTNGYLYKHRNEYEKTLAAINEAVLSYLQKEEETLQQSYPHYFEKYRTDGVEYNIYIGQSIAPNNPFDQLYLKNIRLWQLKSMAAIAKITNEMLPSLPVQLQTTQLLLIHSQPISISFRRDERRFDVEGSYNIRYEIMKKRLDKVHIKETSERLTQPGKIAMVYSNQKEAQEYQEYIQFLQSKKILSPGLEMLELEELQGVSGLKALRVDINLENAT